MAFDRMTLICYTTSGKGDFMSILGVISNNLVVERSDLLKNSTAKLMKNKYGRHQF